MPITYLKGDATRPIDTGGLRYLVHICNSVGGFGRGFVVAVSQRWGDPEHYYRRWFRDKMDLDAGEFKLGAIQVVPVEPTLMVVNMIAQEGYGPNNRSKHQDGLINAKPPIRYDALEECLHSVGALLQPGDTVHGPRFGTGLAGGSWGRIEPLLEQAIPCHDVYIYDYQGD